MTIVVELEQARQRLGRSVSLPVPPACTDLILRARAQAFPVGRLYVVSHALQPDVLGVYEQATGDMWCYADSNDEGHTNMLQTLLVLLAHASLRQSTPETLEQEWKQDGDAVKQAYTLAQRWQMDDLFPQEVRDARLEGVQRLYDRRLLAAEVAGSRSPRIARIAYGALDDLRIAQGWSTKQFWGVLLGETDEIVSATTGNLDLVMVIGLFDRTKLRFRWKYADRLKKEGDRFEEFALPQTNDTHRLLYWALMQIAQSFSPIRPIRSVERKFSDNPLHLHFLAVESDLELPHLIDLVNTWLLVDHLEASAEVMWWCYADNVRRDGPRVYRLMVHYLQHKTRRENTLPLIGCELWVLFLPGHRSQIVETAWQEFILTFLGDVQELRCETLSDGLQMLWSWLGQVETEKE